MVVGVALGIVAYALSRGTKDPLAQNDALTVGLAGISASVVGAALFLRYSIASFLRFWLARVIYEQKAQTAGQNASQAQQVADAANARVGVLTNTVVNLDNYHAVAETSVKFGFNKDNLTPKSKEALDTLQAAGVARAIFGVPSEGRDSVLPRLDSLAKLIR